MPRFQTSNNMIQAIFGEITLISKLSCSLSVFHVAVGQLYATPGEKNSSSSDLFGGLWTSIFLKGFQWVSGLGVGISMSGSWSGDPTSTHVLAWQLGLWKCHINAVHLPFYLLLIFSESTPGPLMVRCDDRDDLGVLQQICLFEGCMTQARWSRPWHGSRPEPLSLKTWSRGKWKSTSHQIKPRCLNYCARSDSHSRATWNTDREHVKKTHESCDWKSGLFHQIWISELIWS